jgi:LPXTG-motif cell wall-anchored protein
MDTNTLLLLVIVLLLLGGGYYGRKRGDSYFLGQFPPPLSERRPAKREPPFLQPISLSACRARF